MKPRRATTPALLIALALLLAAALLERRPAAEVADEGTLVVTGRPIPDFSAVTVDGRAVSTRGLRGRPALLVFFSTYCQACRAELADLQARLAGHLAEDRLAVLAFGREDDRDALLAFRESSPLAFELVPDPDRGIYGLFASVRVPRTYLVDGRGRLVHQTRDFTPEQDEEIIARLDALLASTARPGQRR